MRGLLLANSLKCILLASPNYIAARLKGAGRPASFHHRSAIVQARSSPARGIMSTEPRAERSAQRAGCAAQIAVATSHQDDGKLALEGRHVDHADRPAA